MNTTHPCPNPNNIPAPTATPGQPTHLTPHPTPTPTPTMTGNILTTPLQTTNPQCQNTPTHVHGFVTALSLTPATNPPSPPTDNNPTNPTTLTSQLPQIHTQENMASEPNNSLAPTENPTQAFIYELSPTTHNPNAPTPTTHQPPLKPIQTTLNPYNTRNNKIHYSREYTTQELDQIRDMEQASLLTAEKLRHQSLDSLRIHGQTLHTINAPPGAPPDFTNPLRIIQTDRLGDTASTLTGDVTGTPSSKSTVSFHPTITAGTHTDALHRLHAAVVNCYAAAQADYILTYNAKAIEANLSKIAARQRIEECADATATILNSEETPTPRTVGATIDDRIRKTNQDLEKRIQSLEQKLAHEKNKTASIERRMTQRHTTTQNTQTPILTPTLPTNNTTSHPKDHGGLTVGATANKSTKNSQTPPHHNHTHRWVPPMPPPPCQKKHPAGYNNATTQNTTGRGFNPYATKQHPRHHATTTHYNASTPRPT